MSFEKLSGPVWLGRRQTAGVSLAIIVLQNARQPGVAALHDVSRDACEGESSISYHTQASPDAQRHAIGDCRCRYSTSDSSHTTCRKLSLTALPLDNRP